LEVSHSLRQSKEFCAANEVSCSRKHTLLCSGEHNNPLLKRMLFTGVFLLSMPLALVPFVGAKLLRQIQSGNSNQSPLAATLQPLYKEKLRNLPMLRKVERNAKEKRVFFSFPSAKKAQYHSY